MSDASYVVNHQRSLADIVAELKAEAKEFIQTRVRMFQSELNETLRAVKLAAPMAAIAAVFGFVAFVLLSFGLVALVEVAFVGNAYGWFFSFIIVGFLWLCFAGMMALFAVKRLQGRALFPTKTMQVLKADKAWMQQEARSES
jgi:uncharacterized membrane protein YqjE